MTDSEMERIVRYLKGEATQIELEEMGEWLKEDTHRIRFEHFKEIWISSGEVYRTFVPDLARARERIQTEIEGSVKLNPWKWVGRAAAILIPIVGIAWAITAYKFAVENREISMQEFSTRSAGDSIVLSDGSTVWLNKGTTLKFPSAFNGAERRVFLTGEAFFEVTHNAEMPFIIEGRRTVTKVLGTSFNIKIDKDSVSVAVRTGRVLFFEHDNSTNFEFLEKNEMASFSDANSSIRKSAINWIDIASWRTHPFVFKNSTLSEVTRTLSRYYDTSIRLAPGISEDWSLTTSFEDQSLEEMLQVICATLDLRLETTSEGYLLVRKSN
jgi:transmembrane sensor